MGWLWNVLIRIRLKFLICIGIFLNLFRKLNYIMMYRCVYKFVIFVIVNFVIIISVIVNLFEIVMEKKIIFMKM